MLKYLPHIRIPFKLFDDERLKFVNAQTGKCYPRQATISNMVCLSRSTIYRCTELLQDVGIIKKKRLKSTLLYLINPEYIVNKKIDVSSRPIPRVMMTDISRTNINRTIIDTLIIDCADKGGDKNLIISKLSTLPRNTLIKAIQEKDNPYYCNLALSEQDRKGDGVLVDLPKGIELDKLRKKSNFAYQRVVYQSNRKKARVLKAKDLLSSDSKD